MINFFRKIRQHLLTENKFSKYLLYAFGEIALVMTGILLALQVNNWNEERILRMQIKTNLLNLSSAISQDLELLNQIEESNEFRSISILQTLKWANISLEEIDSFPLTLSGTTIWRKPIPETFNQDFFGETFVWINRPRRMIIQSYAMEELKSLGLYSRITNQKLKDSLNEYYTDLSWYFGGDNISDFKFLDELQDYLRNNHNLRFIDIPRMENPLEFIKNDPGIIVRLRDVSNYAEWRMIGAKTSKMRAVEILKEIQTEITKQ